MRIVHFSDWHGVWTPLPPADLYICTGNMLPNFKVKEDSGREGLSTYNTDIRREKYLQNQYIRKFKESRRVLLGNTPESPVVIVRGDHDYVDLKGLFGGNVIEIGKEPTCFSVNGLKIGGFRGCLKTSDDLPDQISHPEAISRVKGLPRDLDILVTHSPPYRVLDSIGTSGSIFSYGLHALSRYVNDQVTYEGSLRLHCFGMISGNRATKMLGKIPREIVMSNATQGFRVIHTTEYGKTWSVIATVGIKSRRTINGSTTT